jgi:hypothetical protein
VRRARGERHPWLAPNGTTVDLPLVIDVLETHTDTGVTIWSVEATVDLVDGNPALVGLHVRAAGGLDPAAMQREFRWATPVEIATITIPALLEVGIDPFRYHYPVRGFPDAAQVERTTPTRLTDDFLTEIANRYVMLGRGYARTIALQRNVSTRTVVSWVEKARERGILTATRPGAVGGTVRSPRRS